VRRVCRYNFLGRDINSFGTKKKLISPDSGFARKHVGESERLNRSFFVRARCTRGTMQMNKCTHITLHVRAYVHRYGSEILFQCICACNLVGTDVKRRQEDRGTDE
jgi:hypothetical protein